MPKPRIIPGTDEVVRVWKKKTVVRILTHLQAPGDTEGSYAVDIGTTELNEILDQNTPTKESGNAAQVGRGFFLTR